VRKYLTISEGRSPATATPLVATADPRVIRAALREVGRLAEGADLDERTGGEEAGESDNGVRRPRPLRDGAR
jgi:hypothetical protein